MADDLNLVRTQRHVFESSIDASTKLVALALLNHWSRAAETFPSVDRLAKWATVDRTTVMRCVAKLEQLGAIIVTRRNGASNRYQLGQLSLLPVAPCDRSDNATSRTMRPEPVAPCDPTSRTMRPEEIQQEIQEEIHLATRAPDPPMEGVVEPEAPDKGQDRAGGSTPASSLGADGCASRVRREARLAGGSRGRQPSWMGRRAHGDQLGRHLHDQVSQPGKVESPARQRAWQARGAARRIRACRRFELAGRPAKTRRPRPQARSRSLIRS